MHLCSAVTHTHQFIPLKEELSCCVQIFAGPNLYISLYTKIGYFGEVLQNDTDPKLASYADTCAVYWNAAQQPYSLWGAFGCAMLDCFEEGSPGSAGRKLASGPGHGAL